MLVEWVGRPTSDSGIDQADGRIVVDGYDRDFVQENLFSPSEQIVADLAIELVPGRIDQSVVFGVGPSGLVIDIG